MDTREKLIAARVGMLALADELKNISRACQVAGISRTHFYDIKDALERYGRAYTVLLHWVLSNAARLKVG